MNVHVYSLSLSLYIYIYITVLYNTENAILDLTTPESTLFVSKNQSIFSYYKYCLVSVIVTCLFLSTSESRWKMDDY